MRKTEREFLNHVTDEVQPLFTIQKKMKISYEDAIAMAKHLFENKLIRMTDVEFEPGRYTQVVCSPLIPDDFWRNLKGNLITTLAGAIAGSFLTVAVNYISIDHTAKIEKSVHDTIWIMPKDATTITQDSIK